jgi:DNA-binding NarL/FixJ family response regulator
VPIRVVLADDQTLVRAGFRALLERSDDIEVAGEAADGAAAVELVRRTTPDVVLMDVRMPALDGIELIWPLVAISDERWYTLQVGLTMFQGTRRTQWSLLMAGNVIATMPLIVAFIVAQKRFVATMTFTGLKG